MQERRFRIDNGGRVLRHAPCHANGPATLGATLKMKGPDGLELTLDFLSKPCLSTATTAHLEPSRATSPETRKAEPRKESGLFLWI